MGHSGIVLDRHPHHQQTFHMRLLRLAYPDGSSVPRARCSQLGCVKVWKSYTHLVPGSGAHHVWPGPHRRRALDLISSASRFCRWATPALVRRRPLRSINLCGPPAGRVPAGDPPVKKSRLRPQFESTSRFSPGKRRLVYYFRLVARCSFIARCVPIHAGRRSGRSSAEKLIARQHQPALIVRPSLTNLATVAALCYSVTTWIG